LRPAKVLVQARRAREQLPRPKGLRFIARYGNGYLIAAHEPCTVPATLAWILRV
jgi:hypothetical protein